MEPVIGYSTEGSFNGGAIPIQFQEILADYIEEATLVMNTTSTVTQETASKWRTLSSTSYTPTRVGTPVISPLLTTTWNQSNPYNAFCPVDATGPGGHAYAGCVATAMGQIIRYWRFPEHGTGQHSYTANNSTYDEDYGNYGTLSVNFSNSTYNYDNMPDNITASSDTAAINAIARLLYHCGVSVNMKYGPGGSGAVSADAANALNTYFGYSGCVHKNKSSYSETDWKNLLKNELNNLRPMLYHGSGSGGHAFVCDGYDSEDYFHFNWGWSGSYNGYFLLSAMTPGSSHNYNNSQGAIINIDASRQILNVSENSLAFLIEEGAISEPHKITVITHHLSNNVNISVTGNFRISTDGTNFSTSCILSSNGGSFFVRYQPNNTGSNDQGTITITSENLTASVTLVGNTFHSTCLPPQNLSAAIIDSPYVTLSWEEPIMQGSSSTQTLSWNNHTTSINYNYGGNIKISMLQRFSSSDLIPFHGKSLSKISFYASSGATTYKLIVYQGGNYNGTSFDPGQLIYEQPIGNVTSTGWNTITLSNPITINANQELWFGVYAEAPNNQYIIPIGNPYVAKKGCIIGFHYGNNVSWEEFVTNNSFPIEGTIVDMPSVKYYEVFRDSIFIGSTTETEIKDLVAGEHTYTVTANWDNFCSSSAQATCTSPLQLITIPSALDFYNNYGYNNQLQKVLVSGDRALGLISASVTGNFAISTDSIHFLSNCSFPAQGGTLFVKYNPTNQNTAHETGLITLTAGDISRTVYLTGQCFKPCNPPENLSVLEATGSVDLSWDSPLQQQIESQEISWCTDHSSSYGYSNDMKGYYLHRFVPSDLSSFNGKQLSAISFMPHANATTYKIVVYTGGSNSDNTYNPGTQRIEQTVNINQLTSNVWNTIQLSTPIAINTNEELWYGIYMECPRNNYPIYVGEPYVAKKGCIYKNMTNSYSSWQEFLSNCSFVLKATIEDIPATLSNYQIDKDGQTLGNTTNRQYTDHIEQNGEYDYAVWAVWDNGCKAATHERIFVNDMISPTGEAYSIASCNNYTWNGTTYTTSGTYYHNYYIGNQLRIDTLHLTIYNPIHQSYTVAECGSYIWNGTTFTASGTYTYEHNDEHGCTQVDTLHLTIHNPLHQSYTVTECGSYIWNGTTFTESGTYTFERNNEHGCTQVDTLHLTIYNPIHQSYTVAECGFYTWNEGDVRTYSASGTYTYEHNDAHGCTQVDTLHLNIYNPVHHAYTVAECGSYTWNEGDGQTYSASGTYTYEHEDAHGCTQVDTLHLTIYNPVHQAYTVAECGSYTWNEGDGRTYSASGTYTYKHEDAHGCTQVDTLHLTIYNPTHQAYSVTECGSYTWNGTTYSASGTYTYGHEDANGCTQVDTLHLNIYNPIHQSYTVAECGSYTWTDGDGQTYSASGTYTYEHEDAHGCTQVDTLHLSIYKPVHQAYTMAECGSYTWTDGDGQTYSASGTYTYEHEDAHGCTQVDTLHLTIFNPVHQAYTVAECGSYTWNGTTFTESGTYTYEHEDANGCTQVDTLHLTIYNPLHQTYTVAECGSYTWNGTTFTASGTYTYEHNDMHGCTQVDTLHLTIYSPTHRAYTMAECGSYTWNEGDGRTYSASGDYFHEHNDANGCTQVDTLHLTIFNPVHQAYTLVECGSYTWNGTTFTESGTYTFEHNDANGCTQVDTLHLTIFNPVHHAYTVAECGSYTWTDGNGRTYSASGTYTYEHEDANGCTQVDTLHLTIYNPTHQSYTVAECGSYIWADGDGQTYSASGDYFHEHEDAQGCTQVDTLHLNIFNPVHQAYTVAECGSYTWTDGNGRTYSASGTYTFEHNDANGCTQVDTLHLTIFNPVHQAYTVAECGSYTWNGMTFTASGTYTYEHEDENGCTQVDTLHLTIYNPLHQTYTVAECGSYTWNGTTFTESGTYTYEHNDANGCTQVDTLHLTIFNPVHQAYTVTECGSYTWTDGDGRTYSASGAYTYEHGDANGCTQVDTLHLNIYSPTHRAYTVAECGSYTWTDGNGQTYFASGDYFFEHEDANGCTQVDTLHLTIHNPIHRAYTIAECGSYTWNGTTFTESGTYTYEHEDANGCTQVDTLHLNIYSPTHQAYTVAECGSYTWNGTTFTESGTYTYEHEDENGCTQVDTLHITIYNPTHQSYTVAECGSYTWADGNGQTYSASGTYTYEHNDANGCTQVDTLHLNIFSPVHQTYTVAECGSYTWNGATFTASGTYTFEHEDAHGCTQVDTLHLTIHNPVHQSLTVTECCSYTWNEGDGTTFTESGTYTFEHNDTHGCTQVDTLHLTIYNPVHQAYTVAECGSYIWNGTTFTASGTYTYEHEDANDCTQVDTLHLTIYNPLHQTYTVAECGSYTWNGMTFTESGTYTFEHNNEHGCTQVDTLHLTIYNPVHQAYTVAECGSYTWNGTAFTTSGTYTYEHNDANGCTQVDTLHLTIYSPTHRAYTVAECGSYTWADGDGRTYSASGTYTYEHEDAHGCTQVDTLHLNIYNPVHQSYTVAECGSYTWNGTTFTASGTYTFERNNEHGCTQVDTLHLTIHNPVHQAYTVAECGSYTWNGTTFTASGTYTFEHNDANGCTQVDTLHLNIFNPVHQAYTVAECDSYTWNGTTLTASGTYTYEHEDANGCTQVDTLHLTIYNPTHQSYTVAECGSYTWKGTTFTESGTYTFEHNDEHGCTQVDTLNLTIFNPVHQAYTVAECGSYTWNGTTFTASGTYTFEHNDMHGCTQVDTLHLNIFNPTNQSYTVAECGSYTWTDGDGQTYSASGTYTYDHEDAHGCTQVDTLHLNIYNPVHRAYTVAECGSYTWTDGDGQTYSASGTYTYEHEDAHGCTQVDTLHLNIYNPTHQSYTVAECGSYTWNGTTFTASGTYTFERNDAHGCTQVDTLHLTIHNPIHQAHTVAECGSYTWNGTTFTASGTYTYEHEDANGCTQVDTLHLTIYNPTHQAYTMAECGSYTWDGTTFTASGAYTYEHEDAHGCTQVDTLHLTIYSPVHQSYTVAECGSYTWTDGDGQTYSASGAYTYEHEDANGCTQVDTLHLTIYNPTHRAYTVAECGSYTWTDGDGRTYSASGTYTYERNDEHGCTQVDTLHLTILNSNTTEFTMICSDSCYLWNNESYCESGDYIIILTNNLGCDSIVVLHLTINNGIQEYTIDDFVVYPNPTSHIIMVRNDNRIIKSIAIYDVYGQLLRNKTINDKHASIDVSNYATGRYFIRMETSDGFVTKSFIKK